MSFFFLLAPSCRVPSEQKMLDALAESLPQPPPAKQSGLIASLNSVALREKARSLQTASASQILLEKKQAARLEDESVLPCTPSQAAATSSNLPDVIAAVHRQDSIHVSGDRKGGREKSKRANTKVRQKQLRGGDYADKLKSRIGSRDRRKCRMEKLRKKY